MNLEYYIAKRVHFGKDKSNHFSKPAISIAITGIALGIAVMLISVMIVTGFKNVITDKIIGFGSHIRVTNFDNNSSYETAAILEDSIFVQSLKKLGGISSIKRFSTKPGIFKTPNDFQGIVIKGLSADFDPNYFSENIVEGKMFSYVESVRNDSIVISASIAKSLKLSVGDRIDAYFFQDKIKIRRFKVSGIYKTNFQEFDELFVFSDMRHIQQLNGWGNNQISGYEVMVDDYKNLDDIAYEVFLLTANTLDETGSSLRSRSIIELYPQIFSWLALLDTNVWIILGLMIMVSGFNMISGVLILILEKANMVGIVKSLGMKDWDIRKVFLYQAAFLTGKGLLYGNIIGLLFYILQSQWGILSLDPENYYVAEVPVQLNVVHFLLLNAGTLLAIVTMMIIPSILIKKISVTRVINFD